MIIFQKWFHKKGLLGSIAKNAMDQYFKWKKKHPSLSEDEIARNIFLLRYTNPHGIFEKSEKEKISLYITNDFYPQNILEFCLASLDIEGNINPNDGKVHETFAGFLEDYLVDFGYPKKQKSHLDEVFKQLNFGDSKVTDFNVKWFKKIIGLSDPLNKPKPKEKVKVDSYINLKHYYSIKLSSQWNFLDDSQVDVFSAKRTDHTIILSISINDFNHPGFTIHDITEEIFLKELHKVTPDAELLEFKKEMLGPVKTLVVKYSYCDDKIFLQMGYSFIENGKNYKINFEYPETNKQTCEEEITSIMNSFQMKI